MASWFDSIWNNKSVGDTITTSSGTVNSVIGPGSFTTYTTASGIDFEYQRFIMYRRMLDIAQYITTEELGYLRSLVDSRESSNWDMAVAFIDSKTKDVLKVNK